MVRALRPLHAVAVENPACPGTPDINYVDGWIECKWMRQWPSRDDQPVRVPHFTPQQRLWLRERRRAGGRAWLLLQCGRTWVLLQGERAATLLGEATAGELRAAASAIWDNGLDEVSLIRAVSADAEAEL